MEKMVLYKVIIIKVIFQSCLKVLYFSQPVLSMFLWGYIIHPSMNPSIHRSIHLPSQPASQPARHPGTQPANQPNCFFCQLIYWTPLTYIIKCKHHIRNGKYNGIYKRMYLWSHTDIRPVKYDYRLAWRSNSGNFEFKYLII